MRQSIRLWLAAASMLALGVIAPRTTFAGEPPSKPKPGKPLAKATVSIEDGSSVQIKHGASVQVLRVKDGNLIVTSDNLENLIREGKPLPFLGELSNAKAVGEIKVIGADGKIAEISLTEKPTDLPEEVAERVFEARHRAIAAEKQLLEAQMKADKARLEAEQHRQQQNTAAKKAHAALAELQAHYQQQLNGKAAELKRTLKDVESALESLASKHDTIRVGKPLSKEQEFKSYTIHAGTGIPGHAMLEVQTAFQDAALLQHALAKASHAKQETAGINAKLDQILDRLGKLETEVAELKGE